MTHVLVCKKCGHEQECYYPSFNAAERGLKTWRCPECGCPAYEKKPQVSFWQFGPRLKEKQ